MDLSHYFQWKLDIRSLVRSKAWLVKNFHLQPSEIDKMDMWEWNYFIDDINEMVKREEEQHNKEEAKYKSSFKIPKSPTIPKVSSIKY